jgi:hypothetical protein
MMNRELSSPKCAGQVAVMWAGDPNAEVRITPEHCRLHRVFDALREAGIDPEPVVYADEAAGRVRERLLRLDGVLVWVNPIESGRDRTRLDAILREVASAGLFVSAHPDIILKMGTKEVLCTTQSVGWGHDTHLYRTLDAMAAELPGRLPDGRPRVLKQNRGHSGQGIWKVQRPAAAGVAPGPRMRVLVRQPPVSNTQKTLATK